MEFEKECPYCAACNDDLEFNKVMNLESAGLVIYRHSALENNVASASQQALNTKTNVFIIQNTKNRNVSTLNYLSEIEQAIKAIKCPRCSYIMKHTKEVFLSVPFIKKNDVIGICDHCRFKKQNIKRCNNCQETVDEFIKNQEQKQTVTDSHKEKKILISKIKQILKDAPKAVQIGKSKTDHSPSETSLKNQKLSYTIKPTYHVPLVKDMFDNQKKIKRDKQRLKKKDFNQIESTKLYKNKSDSEITVTEAKRRQEHNQSKRNILFNSTENIVWSKSLKESESLSSLTYGLDQKHQHKLRQKQKPKIEVNVTLKAQPSTEILLRQPSTEIRLDSNNSFESYLKKEKNIFSPQKWPSPEQSINEKENIKNKKKYQHSDNDIQHSECDRDISKLPQKKDISLKEIKKKNRSFYNIRRFSSVETLVRSASATTEDKLHKDFSYFFIKETNVKKPPRKRVSSSELIRDTQDMYRAREEEERLKKEELKRKLEAEEKKRLAKKERERQRRLDEEKQLEELKKKMAEEDKNKLKVIEVEQDLNNKEPSKREPSEKSKSIKLKTEIKESRVDTKSEKDSVKSKKEVDKPKKEELMRLEKERKLKEKAEKEEQMRKAKEEKQRQKEEREKEKEKKDDEMRKAKEAKQRQKEESEKEKEKKDDEIRKAKEAKQRQKEESEKEKEKKDDEMRKAKEAKQRQKEAKEKEMAKKEEEMRLAKEEKQRLKEEKEQMAKEQKQKQSEERQKEKEENLRQKEENTKISKDDDEKSKPKQLEQLADDTNRKEAKILMKQEKEAKKREAKLKLKSLKETKAEIEPEKTETKKIIEEPKTKELNINQVKIRKSSTDDLILQLVKLKQTQGSVKERPTRISQLNIPQKILVSHKGHKNIKTDSCMICMDSDLDLDIENIILNETKPEEIKDVIIGEKICKFKPSLPTNDEDKGKIPLLFTSTHTNDENIAKTREIVEHIVEEKERKPPILSAKFVEQEVPKGIIRYALSDRTFIEKGWTMLPTEKVVRKMNVYRMRPAHPEFDWFEHNKSRQLICYDTGEKLAEFDNNGKGRWFYRSGRVALDYYDAQEINAQQRIVIFSSGEPDERGCSRPLAILATFDYLGNGIVFDHSGKIRLKYNQTEGVVLDRAIGPVSHWKWHTLNDPPVLQQVMIDTQMAHKDPEILKLGGPHDDKPRPDNEEMLAIEFDNFIKEKSKKLSQKFKPFQIKMKALKINEHFSLKVLDQATIYLIYRDGSTNLKLNIGMILDHQEIVDTDTAEVGEVSNSLERFPARTDSLAILQRSVAHAQRVERARVERAQRLRPAQPCASADRLTAGLARPRPPPPDLCTCKCRKHPTTNLYYDTRLI